MVAHRSRQNFFSTTRRVAESTQNAVKPRVMQDFLSTTRRVAESTQNSVKTQEMTTYSAILSLDVQIENGKHYRIYLITEPMYIDNGPC